MKSTSLFFKNALFSSKTSKLLVFYLTLTAVVSASTFGIAQTSLESSLRGYFSNSANTRGENWSHKSVGEMWDRIGGESAQFPGGNFTSGDLWQADMPSDIYNLYQNLSIKIFGNVKAVNSGYAFDQSYYNGYQKWHSGLDIQAPSGTPVKTVVSGTSVLIQNVQGNYFIGIKGDDGKLWIYGHLSRYSVALNTRVGAGQLIGYTNGSNHLHLEVQNTHTYQPTYGAHRDRNWLLSVTISPLEAFAQASSSTGSIAFVNGSSRPYIHTNVINLTVSSSNLSGKRVYVQMWRPAVGSYPAREWNYSSVASGTSIVFRDLDGPGSTFAGVDYYTVASLSPIPSGTAAQRRTACYSATSGRQLCDRVRR